LPDNGLVNDLPRKAVTRTAKLAALPLGFAGRRAMGTAKRLGGAPAEAVMAEVQLRTAEQVFKTLGELKGGAMKLGQALSVLEAAVPEELAAPYRQHLTRLQDSAPPMPAARVHRVLTEELGPSWRSLLVEFDDRPAAAASIGQVHRGRWKDGQQVAVKVQYPGAGEALMTDLRQMGRLARTFGGLFPGVDMKALVEEMQDRVAEELDYELEAAAQRVYAEVYADDASYHVPFVVTHTDKLLITEWMDSNGSLAYLITDGTQAERDHYGELFARWIFGSPARTGMLHADPHPGNFRILPTEEELGGLGVLDFGAVARLPGGALPDYIGTLLGIALTDDYAAAEPLLREAGFIRPGIKVTPEDLGAYLGPFMEPARTPTYRFSRQFLRNQSARLSDPRNQGSTMVFRLNLPPSYMLIHRTWIGSIGVLCQLGAEIPFRQILEESIPGFSSSS
jgi:predicted unusual protein kinase regulating ubiquinone biosynthesis (AarF/ABC1/UbiB family)